MALNFLQIAHIGAQVRIKLILLNSFYSNFINISLYFKFADQPDNSGGGYYVVGENCAISWVFNFK